MLFSDTEIKSYAIRSGKSIKEIKLLINKAVKEAESLGKENDKKFIKNMMEDFLDLEENIIIKKLVNLFIESDKVNFDSFIEELISNDIPLDMRPELHLKPRTKSLELEITKNVGEIEDTKGFIEDNIEDNIKEDLLKFKDDPDTILDKDEVKTDKNLLMSEK